MPKRKIKLTKWDSASHLKTEKDIAEYLEVVFEEYGDDPAFIAKALGVAAKARGMTKIARSSGISREGLYKALGNDGNPEFSTILKVLDALGFRLQIARV